MYLDTDVWVYKSFDDLLNCDLFLGYIFDNSLGTAVIGASKGNQVIKEFMSAYQDETFLQGEVVNNRLLSNYFCEHFKDFLMNGKRQTILTEKGEKIEVFSKESFETGKIIGKSYSMHFMDGSWWKKPQRHIGMKIFLARCPINFFAWHKQRFAEKVLKREINYST